jgi:glutathione S-transferase
MARPMKLYSHFLAPNPRRVRIFAAEKGIKLALEEVDILAGAKPHASISGEELVRRGAGA